MSTHFNMTIEEENKIIDRLVCVAKSPQQKQGLRRVLVEKRYSREHFFKIYKRLHPLVGEISIYNASVDDKKLQELLCEIALSLREDS